MHQKIANDLMFCQKAFVIQSMTDKQFWRISQDSNLLHLADLINVLSISSNKSSMTPNMTYSDDSAPSVLFLFSSHATIAKRGSGTGPGEGGISYQSLERRR